MNQWESPMFCRDNVLMWGRVLRLLSGCAMIAAAVTQIPGTLGDARLGVLVTCSGTITILTGFFGFCPTCALAGRKGPRP
jgi:hypothetical protein